MSQKITPCLWFDANAKEAVDFYLGIFGEGKIVSTSYYGEDGPMPAGLELMIEFELAGQRFQAINGGPVFQFSEAVSMSVTCKDQAETDYYWEKLLEGGGATQQCGWLKDRFGLSWQVVPEQVGTMMADPDSEKVARVSEALMPMVKIDIATLQRAYEG